MQTGSYNKLTELYKLLKEDNDTVSGMGGDYFVEDNVKIDWKQAGLYEPETTKDIKLTETALKELATILNGFDKNLETWRKKYAKLGAYDTVSKEQLAQFIAKTKLNLVKLD